MPRKIRKTLGVKFYAEYKGKRYELSWLPDGSIPCNQCAFKRFCAKHEKDADTFGCPCAEFPHQEFFFKKCEVAK